MCLSRKIETKFVDKHLSLSDRQKMKVTNPIPKGRISDYVERILVIENFAVTTPFSLPLFANGTPTLLFISTKATINNKATNYLTLFGQTVFPETLLINKNFTLIAYFLKPFTLFSLFGVSGKELTDYPIDSYLLFFVIYPWITSHQHAHHFHCSVAQRSLNKGICYQRQKNFP